MAKIESNKIQKIFDYLYNPTLDLKKSNGTVVFGRADPLLAKKVGEFYNQNKTDYFLFTGGIGKDSGILTNLEIPEAKFQVALANTVYGVPEEKMYIESNATNGWENCRFSIDKILENNLSHEDMILLSHPTSLRRLNAVMEVIGPSKAFQANYQRAGTEYNFNSENPKDQKEAVSELLRLADWPGKNWCAPQIDLPKELVEYAREIKDSF